MAIKNLNLIDLENKVVKDDRIKDPAIRKICCLRTMPIFKALMEHVKTAKEITDEDITEIILMSYLQGQYDIALSEEEDLKDKLADASTDWTHNSPLKH